MSELTARQKLSDARRSATVSAFLGGLSYYFGPHREPVVRIACLVGSVLAALLALRAIVHILGWAVGVALSGSSVVFRHYGFQKLFASLIAIAIAVGGLTAIRMLGTSHAEPWHYVIPVVLAIVVFLLPDAADRILATSFVNRLFVSGGKPQENFAGGHYITKRTAPIRSKYRSDAGYLSDATYMGRTLPESTLIRKHVWSKDPMSELCCASSGTGKTTHAILNGCFWAGSAFYATVKRDIADALIGRRSDPNYWFGSNHGRSNPGIDVRGITSVTRHIPRGRCYLLDPERRSRWSQQGRYSGHSILSDIDVNDPNAASLIFALMTASVPVNERASEPFWEKCTRGLAAASVGFVLVTERDKSKHTFPHVMDLILGTDEQGRSDPDRFRQTLTQMRRVNALGGIIQAGASAIDELGPNAYGAVCAEIRNSFRWVMLMREHLSKPSSFSYTAMGQDDFPMSVFMIQPDSAPTESGPYMRTHSVLALYWLKRRPPSRLPCIFVGDEYPQWGKGCTEVSSGALVLRSYGIKLSLYVNDYSALVSTVGDHAAQEICSSSTERYFGVNDAEEAERLSKRLGFREGPEGKHPLVSPQDIARELSGIL